MFKRGIVLGVSLLMAAVGIAPTPAQAAIDPSPAGLTMVEPCVILDTRVGTGDFDGPLLPGPSNAMVIGTASGTGGSGQGGETCNVPNGPAYSAVVLDVRVVNVTGAGNLRVYPTNETPGGGVVNYGVPGMENSNVVIVPVWTLTQEVTVEANQGAVDVVVTVIGYLQPGVGAGYTPVTPCAAADSRFAEDEFAGPYVGNETRTIEVAPNTPIEQGSSSSTCGVPPTADGVLVNLVAVGPNGDGEVGVRPAGSTDQTTYVDYAPSINNAAAVFMPISGGELDLFTVAPHSDSTGVRAVILGYVDAAFGENDYIPITPCTAFDSRMGQGSQAPFAGPYNGGEVRSMQLTGNFPAAQGGGATTCGIPAGARAVHVNLVGIRATGVGNLRAYATGTEPTGGVVNFAPISTNNSNAVVVPISADGRLDVAANGGTGMTAPLVEVRGVILGYYLDADQPIEVDITGPPDPTTSPFTITGNAFDSSSVISVDISITDSVTGNNLIAVAYGDGYDWTTQPIDFDFSATMTSPGAASTSFSLGPFELESLGGSGNYSVQVTAWNNAGELDFDTANVRTQVSPGPVGTIEAPLANTSVSSAFEIAGTAVDPNGISSGFVWLRDVNSGQYVNIELSGDIVLRNTQQPIALTVFGQSWRRDLSSGVLDGRTLEIEFLSLTDGNGNNTITYPAHRFIVDGDTAAPEVVIKSPGAEQDIPAPMVVTGQASDSSGVDQVQIQIRHLDTELYWGPLGFGTTPFWTTVDLSEQQGFADLDWVYTAPSGVGTGPFEIQVRAIDEANKITVTAPVKFNVG